MHPALAAELEAQNAAYLKSPVREANLARLREGARVVITGQQVGLFLGPLYTLYKAAAAIQVARVLTKETGQHVAPVFWLQTEDHDIVEIASVRCATQRISLPVFAHNRISMAHLPLPKEVTEAVKRVQACVGHLPYADEHLAQLSRHYQEGKGYSEAFAGLLAEVFAEEGLVLFNPRTQNVAPLAIPIHRKALTEADIIANALSEGQNVVHVRPRSPLSFFHPEGAIGPRYRLKSCSGGFSTVGGGPPVYTLEELLTTLDREPLRFSTSALLRPLLQDSLFHTAVYLGGPSELSYFKQLAPLYPLFGQVMPKIAPRAHFILIDKKTALALDTWGLTPPELERPLDELLARLRPACKPSGLEVTMALEQAFEETLQRFSLTQVATPLRKTRSSLHRISQKLGDHVDRQAARQNTALVEELSRLQEALYPDGTPQERVYGFSVYASRYGARSFVQQILRAVRPFDDTLIELAL